ncbi:MAG TPA: amidohydrolase family protein [Pyrinomonadaceae bacterium]|nr:amidohydrolase family protein [Pyrinomonadaceae bacterium]
MHKAVVLLSILLLTTSIAGQTGGSSPQGKVVAFINVNVIPMDRERVIRNQTVIVRNNTIAAIGDAKRIKVPAGAQKVDGTDKFLIPGLMDMHVHLFSDDEFPDSLAEDEFKVMIAYGVTTIRLMIGTPEQLVLREKSAKGEILAPTIFAASPHLTGRKQPNAYVVTTEAEARAAVVKSKRDGYDFIKVTTYLAPEVYEAIVDEASKQNIRVVGHADSRSVGLQRALKARQQIEHLDSYLEALLPDNAPVKGSVSDIYVYNPKNWESIDYLDEKKIPELARLTVKANPFVTPTLHLFKFTFGKGRSEESFMAQPDIRFYPRKTIDQWTRASKRYLSTAAPVEKREKYVRVRNQIVKAIYDAGGRIMAGSDTPEWLMLYGHTLHLELIDLRDAGLSNYAALETATRNPAMYLGLLDQTGTIEKRKRGDLVLLDANPLDDIANTQKRAGVMIKGQYFTQTEMDRWLDEIAPRFQHALDEKK